MNSVGTKPLRAVNINMPGITQPWTLAGRSEIAPQNIRQSYAKTLFNTEAAVTVKVADLPTITKNLQPSKLLKKWRNRDEEVIKTANLSSRLRCATMEPNVHSDTSTVTSTRYIDIIMYASLFKKKPCTPPVLARKSSWMRVRQVLPNCQFSNSYTLWTQRTIRNIANRALQSVQTKTRMSQWSKHLDRRTTRALRKTNKTSWTSLII